MEKKRLTERLRDEWGFCALPFVTSLAIGLAAHMTILTNKIPIDDDICNMFNKGATTVSGRYGLKLMSLIMPDVSMPWIYGLMSLLLICAAICVTIKLFHIRNRALQILLGGVFISFPAETGTLSYMFTCAPYAAALLAAVGAVYVFAEWKTKWRWLVSPALLVFSCSIYQGYFGFAASFCVILMIRSLMRPEGTAEQTFKAGLKMLAMLALSAAAYGVSVLAMNKLLALPVLDVINKEQSILMRVAVAYSAFLHTLFDGYFAYVNTGASRVMHLAVLLLCLCAMAVNQRKLHEGKRTLLLLACLALLPLSCYCLYLLADNGYIHSLALYPFAAVYVLAAVILGEFRPERFRLGGGIAAAALAVIIMGNVYFANSFYLRCELQYENVKAFYTAMLPRVMQTEGFNEGTKVAIIGEMGALRYDVDEHFDFDKFQLPGNNITKTTHAKDIINNYLGMDIPLADEEETERLRQTEAFAAMPCYPYDGSVRMIEGVVVVKLS